MKGRFITIEGVEGVGKSTNLALVADLVREAGHKVIVTREPGGTRTGERIREILLDKEEAGMTPMTELLLMFASRAQHVEEVILPALDAGTWVISDRFTDSSFAYQGGGRQLGIERVAAMQQLVLGAFRPDLTLLLDLDVQTGLERATANTEADRFESEQRAFFERVRQVFLELAKSNPWYEVIDAGRPLVEVQASVRAAVSSLLDRQ
ncbi:MAG: dTMP kinase [Proteobacteria bacterium]|nr:dTMP kinase [Pseudomonadota bacterium]